MSGPVFSFICDDVVLYRELFKREGSALDVACQELVAFFVMKGVPHPDAKAFVVLGEYLCHVIISDKLLFMELGEHPLSKGLLYYVDSYLREPGEHTVIPVAVSEHSV